ncbi:U-box domain-containing protein 19-like [Andrographis paniculata]|uniref:U-box domain-containing protein 19-like n=1 Tax=Andrographis paniculata TaxID=175694 RepID=UPI0021E7BA43|nr:U-box domain-containing protein 19-like [Andrographis paniculata]
MTRNSDHRSSNSARRIFKFPAVRPCEGISPATLLQSLITTSTAICSYSSNFFPSQRRNARETIRQVSILSILLEEFLNNLPTLPESSILCLSELHVAFQKLLFLLEDCTREDAKLLTLMKSYFVSTQFQNLINVIATTLDVLLPLNQIEVSEEVKELIQMVYNQSRRSKMEVSEEDEIAMKRVIVVLNQFENKLEPDPFMIRKILSHLKINSHAECHKEILFLDEELTIVYSEKNDREVPLLSSLVGLLSYCRGTLFTDWENVVSEQYSAERASSFSSISRLNPEDFRCPISLELMTDPVTISTGQTYDRSSIEKWLKSGNLVCPKTGEKLTTTELVPNTSLRKLIEQYCAEYGISFTSSVNNNRDISRTILPGSAANEKAINLLSEFLALRLAYGSDSQKTKAAYEVRLLSKSSLFNRSCLIDIGSVIPALIKLIISSDAATQENAISALSKLSKQTKGQKAIIQNRGLHPILAVLKNGLKLESKQLAAATIFYIAAAKSHRKMIGEFSDAIPALLSLIRDGTPCGKKNSVMAIFALIFNHRNRRRAITAGAVKVLLDLLNSPEKSELKTDALAVLSTLTSDSSEASIEIRDYPSGLQLILRLLQTINSPAGQEYCVSILLSLSQSCEAEVVPVMAKDATLMSGLYSLITDGTSHAGKKARSLIKVLQKFCETSSSGVVKEMRRLEESINVR